MRSYTRSLCGLLSVLALLSAPTADAVSVPVNTLTHNVDGANWAAKSVDLLATLSAQSADIMSLQEVLNSSTALADLKTNFVDSGTYAYSAGYYDSNPANEVVGNITDSPIFWRTGMFSIDWARSGAVRWPGTGFPMAVNWVTLIHNGSGIEIIVFNTHLRVMFGPAGNAGENQEQALFLAQTVEANRARGQIAIITGDMNASNLTPTIRFLLDGEELLGETFSMAFSDVEGSSKGGPIDYIMVPASLNLACASVLTLDTASDHDLVAARINLDDGDQVSVADCEGRAFLTPPLDPGVIVDGTRVFDLEMRPGITQFFPGTDTATSGYNGSYLGPTLAMRSGEDVQLNVTNHLGGRETTTHWHGLHVPPSMDGGPHQIIAEDETWSAEFPIFNRAATYWYHPHPHAMGGAQDVGGTSQQVYEGLAGLLIVRDDASDALVIPDTYGIDDFPLILQDKAFNPDGSLFHLNTAPGGVRLRRGGNFLTNGIVSSILEVPAQVIRFRLLNASNARFYNLGMNDNRSFYQIGSDGGLLPASISLTRLLIGPGERVEILVDFGQDQDGRVTLRAYNSELAARIVPNVIADGWDRTDFDIMDFNAVAPSPGAITSIPGSLVPVEEISELEAHNLGSPRPFELSLNTSINNQEMDINVVNETIQLGDTEIWLITNATQMAHPFHVHGDSFQILTRDGVPPSSTEIGWKDVVVVEPGEEVRIIKRFRDYADPESPFMYHCHILDHEDAGMMGQFVVVASSEVPVSSPAAFVALGLSLVTSSCIALRARSRFRRTEGG